MVAQSSRKASTSLHTKSVNMLEGLTDEEVEEYLHDHPKIVPLYEIDIGKLWTEEDIVMKELGRARETLE